MEMDMAVKKVEFTDDYMFIAPLYNVDFKKGFIGSVKAEHADAAIAAGKAKLASDAVPKAPRKDGE